MSVKAEIQSQFEQVAREQKKRLAPLSDDLVLLDSGLDSLCIAIIVARLVGANRRYIEEEIPHIASLMCRSAAELLRHAEVVVIGTDGEEAAVVLSGADGRHVVIDLTRGAARPR